MASDDAIDNKAFMNAFRQKNKLATAPNHQEQETPSITERKSDRALTLSTTAITNTPPGNLAIEPKRLISSHSY